MTIYVYPADAFGCGHYRLIWPGLELAKQDHDVKVIAPDAREGVSGDIDIRGNCPQCGGQVMPKKQVRDGNLMLCIYVCFAHDPPAQWQGYGKIKELKVPDDAQAIVLQRVTLSHMVNGLKLLRETRPEVAVIIDMDDDLRHINPDNPAFWGMHSKWGHAEHNQENAMQACLNATLVTVSTPALLRVYAPHGRGMVLYNRVPAGYLDIPHEDSATMSWPGSTHSHPWDLAQVGPAVARLVRDGASYMATGSPVGVKEALGLDADPMTNPLADETGDIDFGRWPWAVAQIGVGLAPLADTRFNTSKSWLKPLEMSAVGVPWVASPLAEYDRLHRDHDVGLVATSRRDWHRQLARLVNDEVLRKEQSEAGRAAARANTVEGHAWRWLEAWQSAMMRELAATPSTVRVDLGARKRQGRRKQKRR